MKSLTRTNALNNISFVCRVALITILAGITRSASAQVVYTGDAYGAKIQISAPLLVGADALVVDNPNLPTAGSAVALTNQLATANADVRADTGLSFPFQTSFGVLSTNSAGANAIQTSTIGTGLVVTSSSQILNATLFPNASVGTNLAVSVLGGLNLTSLVQADVIRSTTTANVNSNSGRTEITNLRFGGNSLGNFDLTSSASTTYYLNLLGGVSLTPNAVVNIADVASLVINNQTTTPDGKTRTTEAITLNVLTLGQRATGSVVVASSTAGIVVPESGTLVYAASACLMLVGTGMVRLRRAKK